MADSVYVSLYKDLGVIAGARIGLAKKILLPEARVWNRRAGGNLISFYPYLLAAEQGLEENLASISDAVAYAQRLGPLLATYPKGCSESTTAARSDVSPSYSAQSLSSYCRNRALFA